MRIFKNKRDNTNKNMGFIIFLPFFMASEEPSILPKIPAIVHKIPILKKTTSLIIKVIRADTLEPRLTIFAVPEA